MGRTSLSAADSKAAPASPIKGPKKPRFEEIFKEGKRAAGSYCRMTALPGSGLVGIATSKKIGTTPQRNRAKRRLREALRANEAVLNPHLDFVALAMPESVGASLEALIADTGRLLRSLTERWAAESESS